MANDTNNPITGLAATSYSPKTLELDKNLDTVEGRLASITKSDSPLQRVARTSAMQQANRRGLLNTSMAIGAAQKANIESSLPIASQDAATSFAAKQANQAAINQARQFNTAYGQQLGTIEATGNMESRLMAEKEDIDKRMLTASTDEQMRLMNRQQTIDTELQKLRGTQAMEQLKQSGAQSMEQLQASGNLEKELAFQKGEIQKQLISADADQKARLMQQQKEIDMQLLASRTEASKTLQAQMGDINYRLQELRGTQQGQLTAQQAEEQRRLEQMRGDIQTGMQKLIGSQALEQQGLKGEQARELQKMESDYSLLMKTQDSASYLYSNTALATSQILANPDISDAAKQGLVDKQLEVLKSGLNIIGSISDMDLTGIITPTSTTPANATTGPIEGQYPQVTGWGGPQAPVTNNTGTLPRWAGPSIR